MPPAHPNHLPCTYDTRRPVSVSRQSRRSVEPSASRREMRSIDLGRSTSASLAARHGADSCRASAEVPLQSAVCCLSLSRAREPEIFRALQFITALLLRCRCCRGVSGAEGRGGSVRPCGCVGGRMMWRGGWLVTAAVERVDGGSHVPTVPRSGARSEPRRCENLSCLGPENKKPATKVRVRGNMAAHPLKSHPVR